ncbi:MAG: HD domain-containing protein [Nitrospirota bacterium]
MNLNDLNALKNRFSDYCRSFYFSGAKHQKNIALKEAHTHEVCKNIVLIATEQRLSKNDIMLAETVALFHDVGRFSQYEKYKTFRDSISVNHGKLGAEILEQEEFIKNLSEDEQKIVINSVKFHNAFGIPALKNQKALLFLKLIRDADKLDIWRVFFEYYESSGDEKASAAALGLPDTPDYSKTVLSRIYKKQLISLTSLRTLNDFRLLQLSWIYDLNFKTSFRLLLERDYIRLISAKLPWTDEVGKITALLKEFAAQRLKDI